MSKKRSTDSHVSTLAPGEEMILLIFIQLDISLPFSSQESSLDKIASSNRDLAGSFRGESNDLINMVAT